jgi:hypothetical protein
MYQTFLGINRLVFFHTPIVHAQVIFCFFLHESFRILNNLNNMMDLVIWFATIVNYKIWSVLHLYKCHFCVKWCREKWTAVVESFFCSVSSWSQIFCTSKPDSGHLIPTKWHCDGFHVIIVVRQVTMGSWLVSCWSFCLMWVFALLWFLLASEWHLL